MQVFLETERLVLRQFIADDVNTLFKLNSDEDFMQFLTRIVLTYKMIQNDISLVLPRSCKRFTGFGIWVAIKKESQEGLGCFTFGLKAASSNDVELGYWLHQAAWGQGYATEGARALIRLGFSELGVQRVFATASPEHIVSRRVMEKVGMTLVRTYHLAPSTYQSTSEDHLWDGDLVEYVLQKANWEQQETAGG